MSDTKFRVWSERRKKYITEVGGFDLVIKLDGSLCINEYGDLIGTGLLELTVEQFTGLKDKNGVEIYDGDVYKHGDTTLTIIWYEYVFVGYDKEKDEYSILNKHHQQYYEVAGNIHEEVNNV